MTMFGAVLWGFLVYVRAETGEVQQACPTSSDDYLKCTNGMKCTRREANCHRRNCQDFQCCYEQYGSARQKCPANTYMCKKKACGEAKWDPRAPKGYCCMISKTDCNEGIKGDLGGLLPLDECPKDRSKCYRDCIKPWAPTQKQCNDVLQGFYKDWDTYQSDGGIPHGCFHCEARTDSHCIKNYHEGCAVKVNGKGDTTNPVPAGLCCQFPFTWQGKTYNRCIKDGTVSSVHGWCSINRHYDNGPDWGGCDREAQFKEACFTDLLQCPTDTTLIHEIMTSGQTDTTGGETCGELFHRLRSEQTDHFTDPLNFQCVDLQTAQSAIQYCCQAGQSVMLNTYDTEYCDGASQPAGRFIFDGTNCLSYVDPAGLRISEKLVDKSATEIDVTRHTGYMCEGDSFDDPESWDRQKFCDSVMATRCYGLADVGESGSRGLHRTLEPSFLPPVCAGHQVHECWTETPNDFDCMELWNPSRDDCLSMGTTSISNYPTACWHCEETARNYCKMKYDEDDTDETDTETHTGTMDGTCSDLCAIPGGKYKFYADEQYWDQKDSTYVTCGDMQRYCMSNDCGGCPAAQSWILSATPCCREEPEPEGSCRDLCPNGKLVPSKSYYDAKDKKDTLCGNAEWFCKAHSCDGCPGAQAWFAQNTQCCEETDTWTDTETHTGTEDHTDTDTETGEALPHPTCPTKEHDDCCKCVSDEEPVDWDNGRCCGSCSNICTASKETGTGTDNYCDECAAKCKGPKEPCPKDKCKGKSNKYCKKEECKDCDKCKDEGQCNSKNKKCKSIKKQKNKNKRKASCEKHKKLCGGCKECQSKRRLEEAINEECDDSKRRETELEAELADSKRRETELETELAELKKERATIV